MWMRQERTMHGEMVVSRAMILKLIEKAHAYDWTLQGFGMFRLYLDECRSQRLHVWSPGHAVKGVTTIHTHPWDFESKIYFGQLRDVNYTVIPEGATVVATAVLAGQPTKIPFHGEDKFYLRQRIVCGEGGGVAGDPEPVRLIRCSDTTYTEGHSYLLNAEHIHETFPESETITIVRRFFREDTEHASVFYPEGTSWISAEPRKATPEELTAMQRIVFERLEGVAKGSPPRVSVHIRRD